jgi:endonuclease/exonuclease/phosphatase family metal-dependent hydrolase
MRLVLTLMLALNAAIPVPADELYFAFWNVENLFDTIDDPKVELDEEFTPTAPKQWTQERYEKKLQNLAQVIRDMNGGKGPDVLGLCEVENAAVVNDLIRKLEPLKRKYRLLHRDSPSARGIDCALLVDEARASVSDTEFHLVPGVKTRDIVEAKVMMDGKTLFVFMNHWPSRGGDKDGEQREKAAKVLRKRVDEILHADAAADIVIGGDLNDHPTDKSVREILHAETDKSKLHDATLFDTMGTIPNGTGTYFFEGHWEIIDHVIVSRGLLDEKGFRWRTDSTTVIRNDYQLFKPRDGEPRPNRTYGGDKYYGGYSDHTPVACVVEMVNP